MPDSVNEYPPFAPATHMPLELMRSSALERAKEDAEVADAFHDRLKELDWGNEGAYQATLAYIAGMRR
jgi:hypothetical protein